MILTITTAVDSESAKQGWSLLAQLSKEILDTLGHGSTIVRSQGAAPLYGTEPGVVISVWLQEYTPFFERGLVDLIKTFFAQDSVMVQRDWASQVEFV